MGYGTTEKAELVADGELKPTIGKVLAGSFDGASLADEGWIRVSSLASLCPREEVIVATDNLVRSEPFRGDLGLIFEHGHALHWDLQNRTLPATGMFYGKWLCAACGAVHGGWDAKAKPRKTFTDSQILRPEKCPACETKLDHDNCLYQEQHLFNHEYKVKGHPDGFLKVPGLEGLGVFEAKSINPKGAWEVRGCPKLDHVVQVQCYMWLTGCRWAKILYWDKGGQGMSALIEHTVEYDEDLVESIKGEVTAIWVGIEDGILPDRTCEERTCPRASKCPAVSQCFSRD